MTHYWALALAGTAVFEVVLAVFAVYSFNRYLRRQLRDRIAEIGRLNEENNRIVQMTDAVMALLGTAGKPSPGADEAWLDAWEPTVELDAATLRIVKGGA